MIEFNRWVTLKAAPLLIVSLVMVLPSILWAEAAVIKDLRIGSDDEYVRMVLEIDSPLTSPPSFSFNGNILRVTLTGIINDLPAPHPGEYHGDIVSVDISNTSQTKQIAVVFAFDPADVKTFSLIDPHRFIIDAYRPDASAAANLADQAVPQVPTIEKNPPLPSPTSQLEKPLPTGASLNGDEASLAADGSNSSNKPSADDLKRNHIQQQLVAALIVVTSIIIILLLLLIFIGNGQKKPQEPSWKHHLPPPEDQNIESIDSVIRGHLKDHDHI